MNGEKRIRSGGREVASEALAAHVAECAECRAANLALANLSGALRAAAVEVDAAAMSQRVLRRLRPELQRLAGRALWGRVAGTLLRALVPLPLVVACNVLVLRVAYLAISELLSPALATYLMVSYSAFLILLFALTYAAIPLVLARQALPEASVRA